MGYCRDGKTPNVLVDERGNAAHLGGDGFEVCPRRVDLDGFIVLIVPMDAVRRKWTMGK